MTLFTFRRGDVDHAYRLHGVNDSGGVSAIGEGESVKEIAHRWIAVIPAGTGNNESKLSGQFHERVTGDGQQVGAVFLNVISSHVYSIDISMYIVKIAY